jgi:hypothetical protein
MTQTIRRVLVAVSCWAAHAAGAADFNGDGKQDLVWRSHAGNPVVWQMNGFAVASRSTLATAPDSGSAIVAIGNFFGSGAGAILWVDSLNRLSLWRVSNGSIQQSCIVASGIDPGWQFLGSGDVNADGVDDVAWRAPDGSVNVYLMNGCTAPQTVTLTASANPAWQFLGIGDVDTHSDSALFWRDNSSGDVILWRVRNGNSVLPTTLSAGTYASWNVVAVADFDGDGRADLLWRNGNQTALWLMNGTKFTAAAVTAAAGAFGGDDTLFSNGFDTNGGRAPPLSSSWTILGAADVNGDGRADVVLADNQGNAAIWQMQGASIQATGLIAPSGDMPYAGLTGWRIAMDRPTVTKVNNQVTVAWKPVSGSPSYTVYASSANNPASGGAAIAATGTSLSFGRNDAGYADKRYFALSAGYLGVQLPPSPEAYIVEFAAQVIPEWGAMAIADINHDGCVDILDALGDCHGNFTVLDENAMGLGALRANNRQYRDLRYADLDGDGIDDLISNVYTNDSDTSSTVMMFRGTGNNHFVEDSAFTALGIRGWGETVVIADFNNDGYLDIFLPQYSMDSASDHSWLLINDGHGHFTDVSDLTGLPGDPDATVALRSVPMNCRVEGAQAVDVNGDGKIDLYVASHLFLNQGADANGIPHFLDTGPRVSPSSYDPNTVAYYDCSVTTPSPSGLPLFHDEGAKFFDLDNSGQLALLIDGEDSSETGGPGIGVFKLDALGNFSDYSDVVPHLYMEDAWGIQAVDVDGDGLPDILLVGGCDPSFVPTPDNDSCPNPGNPHVPPHLLLNRGGHFVQHDFYQDGLDPTQVTWFDAPAAADFDLSGTMDLAMRALSLWWFQNQASSADTIVVSVVGTNGEHNQAGRVAHVSPALRPGVIMTQIVDGGSGYLANSQYDLTFATPGPGAYTVSVRFANATYTATAHSGDHVTLRANGTYSIQ